MILQLTTDAYPSDEFAVGLQQRVEVEVMAQHAHVLPGTYAFTLVERLHWLLFERSVDLKYDYQRYFAVEYKQFGEYLVRRHRLGAEQAREVEAMFGSHAMIFLFDPGLSLLYGGDVITLLHSLLGTPA
jgi:hypothetical protein